MTGAITTLLLACCPSEDQVRVTVVVILASKQNIGVDKKLVDLAKEVQKRDETLIGFKIVTTLAKSIPVGDGHTFRLIDKQVFKVRVEEPKDANGRISLTINPPELDKITYSCTCEKYFSVVTPYQTKNGEVLIIAVMAKPCLAGKTEKFSWVPWKN